MELLSAVIGLLLGAVASFIFFTLKSKVSNVSKSEYDAMTKKFNETNTMLQIEANKCASQQEELAKLSSKVDVKDAEIIEIQSKIASYQTTIQNYEQKLTENSTLLVEKSDAVGKLEEEKNKLNQLYAIANANNLSLTESLDQLHAQQRIKEKQMTELNELNNSLIAKNSTLSAINQALEEKLSTQKEEIKNIQENSFLQFEKIANQILEEKSGKFTDTNKANIEALLKPLGDNIENFKKKVEETYDKESKERFSLESKVRELVEQTNKVSNEANNLATALKGQSKKQGDWGEMILESILQHSGLAKDREYFLQQTIKDEDGNNLRPDVLVKLPDERVIIIDSKVSLVAYEKYYSANCAEEQGKYAQEHIKSIRKHIEDLHGKKYDNLESSLDFTMMFVPIEPAYMVAVQNDKDLWEYAYTKRILLISPTNLIACLKLMADLWIREMQSKNAMEIVKRGERLYDKFVTFVSTLEDMGKHIRKTEECYSAAMGQLTIGNGNLVGQAIKLRGLGLKSNKTFSPAILNAVDDGEDIVIDSRLFDNNGIEPILPN